jgi:hypothetical protein
MYPSPGERIDCSWNAHFQFSGREGPTRESTGNVLTQPGGYSSEMPRFEQDQSAGRWCAIADVQSFHFDFAMRLVRSNATRWPSKTKETVSVSAHSMRDADDAVSSAIEDRGEIFDSPKYFS